MKKIDVENDIIIRKANKDDNLKRISELIYEVDNYIYPYWFETLEKAKKELSKLILEEKFIFNINTIYIAINKNNNEIVGITSIVDNNIDLEFDYEKISKNDRSKYTIENYILPMIDIIKQKNIATITNMCVKKEYRNNRIGYHLLKYVIEEYKKRNIHADLIEFDVLKDNISAIKLYKSLGFEKVGNIEDGFNGKNMNKPKIILMSLNLK